ncbi:MAG: hypothetical protein N2578_08750, partial [Bdellovibrionaceae bacterium]|nr:hypothetical protein [Pseudobdellovibrionaceae bacterium]
MKVYREIGRQARRVGPQGLESRSVTGLGKKLWLAGLATLELVPLCLQRLWRPWFQVKITEVLHK